MFACKAISTTHLLHKLRGLMKNKNIVGDAIQAYIVPSCDAHQSEYIAACDNRREFISGFSGSAGTAVITESEAAMWTDGRYFLQAQSQMDSNWKLMKQGLVETLSQEEWLLKVLPEGSRVGVDPFLFPADLWKQFSSTLETEGHTLVAIETNLIDVVWGDERPAAPQDEVFIQEFQYAGKTWQDKIYQVRKKMEAKQADNLVITALDEVAWLFNLRGSDIVYNPVFFAYAVVGLETISLFIDKKKLSPAVESHLQESSGAKFTIDIQPYNTILNFLQSLYTGGKKCGKTWISRKSSHAINKCIPLSKQITQITPICTLKAVKNTVEIEGMKKAHIRDAVALCEYFCWLEKEIVKGTQTEISASNQLEKFRREQELFVSLSFDTISSSGANGAIIHYKATPETDRPLRLDESYLCDSGAQYRDGTTDVTRTMHFGTPTQHQKDCFTRVLKGVIGISSAVFPNGTNGHQLDCLARLSLWNSGLDYLHGTGHGVGSFLNVHEGPQGISYKTSATDVHLEAGMFLSDEPGYYEDGQFGIRLENIVFIKPTEREHNFRNRGFLTFEEVTLVPIQTKMIDASLLNAKEVDWLNNYHMRCRKIVGDELLKQGRNDAWQWLMKETTPLG
ncbi:xaa-Pro aminopeptidase 1-like [Anneissia japonica]|uniref:xaa-Pro aminopeptidase 1-like n=1 Tax=Anneissia japonica TaxID=1529436 RepID=UPI001425534C|nr:xaa-Pro aminopeptidase 1-like [Anneissia japonica]